MGPATMTKSLLLAMTLLLSLPALGEELVPLKLLTLRAPDGAVGGELLLLHRSASEEEPLAGVMIVETPQGDRARLIHYLDTERGVFVERMEDLSSGWFVERSVDTGMGDLGDADDYASPWDWVAATGEHRRRLQAVPTYRIETSDGIRVEWSGSPAGDVDAAARAAHEEAMATLATELAASPLPESTRRELAVIARFSRNSRGELSGIEDLVGELLRASRAAQGEVPDGKVPDFETVPSAPRGAAKRVAELMGAIPRDEPPAPP